MAEIKVPIQVNLPDDWVEQVVKRLRDDPEAEWVEIVRCKYCKHRQGSACDYSAVWVRENGFCNWGERKEGEEQ